MSSTRCAFCCSELSYTFVDLGMAPLVSSYLKENQLHEDEPMYPVHAYVCERCFLVQLPSAETPENIFSEYPYFSSISESWLRHAREYVTETIERFGLGPDHSVVEIASNDGYLLQYFKERGVPVLGVEPARNVAKVAEEKGIPTVVEFFGDATARRLAGAGKRADLLVGNNVLAHVPSINDFVAGLKQLLKPGGVITMEFPHLLRTMSGSQFDQVFHEHCSYLSLLSVEKILDAHGLGLFDVKELPTHGGSIRIYAKHHDDDSKPTSRSVADVRSKESTYGLDKLETYRAFSEHARRVKHELREFLAGAKRAGLTVAGYGAPGKGCILLNYCGVRSDLLEYLVDRSPAKQGFWMPGVHIPIHHPEHIRSTKPDYVLILPWNLKDEIMHQLEYVREWGGRFVVPIPEVLVVD